MLTFLVLVTLFTLPFFGAKIATSGRTLSRTSNAFLMGGLLLWLLLVWSTAIGLAWPVLRNALHGLAG